MFWHTGGGAPRGRGGPRGGRGAPRGGRGAGRGGKPGVRGGAKVIIVSPAASSRKSATQSTNIVLSRSPTVTLVSLLPAVVRKIF